MRGDFPGWFIAGAFSLGALKALFYLLINRARLIVTAEGFTTVGGPYPGTYSWNDVGPFYVEQIENSKSVRFAFSDSYRERQSLFAAAFRWIGVGCEGQLPDNYGMDAQALADLLNERRLRTA